MRAQALGGDLQFVEKRTKLPSLSSGAGAAVCDDGRGALPERARSAGRQLAPTLPTLGTASCPGAAGAKRIMVEEAPRRRPRPSRGWRGDWRDAVEATESLACLDGNDPATCTLVGVDRWTPLCRPVLIDVSFTWSIWRCGWEPCSCSSCDDALRGGLRDSGRRGRSRAAVKEVEAAGLQADGERVVGRRDQAQARTSDGGEVMLLPQQIVRWEGATTHGEKV